MRYNNLILMTDSYKFSHWKLLPDGTEMVWSYLESRGGAFSETLFFGLQYYIKEYLLNPITLSDIKEAEERVTKHMGPGVFNRAGWEYILDKHNGFLPLRIRAVPEGLLVPNKNILMSLENTDSNVPWLTNYVETLLLKIWYGITTATLSYHIKKLIKSYLEKTGDVSGLPFKLHDFGYRGVSSEESSMIGGMAHLVNFMGSDTFSAIEGAKNYYADDMCAYSIPASEHSVMSILGPEGEPQQMQRFLNAFKDGPYPAIACVSDTYDIFNACKNYWGGQFKGQVENLHDKVLTVRPDSGIPHVIVRQVLEILDEAFGHTVNEKGYKVLNHVRVIQGDGINYDEIKRILDEITIRKYSADNIFFGMGGALLQQTNRDTQRMAIKAASAVVNGYVRDVYKSPITDNGKRSKAGRLKLVYNTDGVLETVGNNVPGHDVLETVFENGKLIKGYTLKEIRERSEQTSDELTHLWEN